MPLRPLLVGLAIGPALWLGAVGCGPLQYISTVPMDASGAVAEARHLDADKCAPYEITAATEYLHQSRVLAGYARFHSSVEFGRRAAKLAREAQSLCHEKTAVADAAPTGTPSR